MKGAGGTEGGVGTFFIGLAMIIAGGYLFFNSIQVGFQWGRGMYNMGGFQTKMAYGEQKEIFRMIPGLEEAEFLKLGSIHRNLYLKSPSVLNRDLSSKKDPWLFFAGQITGVEGYFESTCIGLMVARFLADKLNGNDINWAPRQSALGSLHNAITEEKEHFQPTNINWSLFPVPEDFKKTGRKNKREKRDLQIQIAQNALSAW